MNEAEGKILLAVLAHPDDEMGFASVLAHYAGRGADVFMVSLTAGQKGFRPHTDIREAEDLARVRREEFKRSARVLGAREARVLEFVDQELLGPRQDEIRRRLGDTLEELTPHAVITFGPDGITGHPDHRAASCFVTELLQAKKEGESRLFYHGLHPQDAARFAEEMGRTLHAVAERHLTTRIQVSEEDVETGLRAIQEHRSQFSPEFMDQIRRIFRDTTREVWFRRVFPAPGSRGKLERSLFG